MSMNPPPPMLPAGGCTTASAKPTATAESIALPPACMISTPTCVANWCTVTTIACCVRTGCTAAQAQGSASAHANSNGKINDFFGDRMLGLWKPEMPESIEASRAQRAESNLAEKREFGSSTRRLVRQLLVENSGPLN